MFEPRPQNRIGAQFLKRLLLNAFSKLQQNSTLKSVITSMSLHSLLVTATVTCHDLPFLPNQSR